MIKSGQLKKLPNTPGVYLFQRGRAVLYVGKATNLRSRVRSYLGGNLAATRGEWLVKMLELATGLKHISTDSVLEALILEAALIKKYQPAYNTKEKDGKSFSYVVITKEKWPRVLLVRGSQLSPKGNYLSVSGPFPSNSEIKTGLKILRKIFPFRDKCVPESGKLCFNAQIGLCPGVCAGLISPADYRQTIRQLKLFFAGKKKALLRDLTKQMKKLAAEQNFESANLVKKRLFALKHIQDVALLKNIEPEQTGQKFRLEAYDVAHLGGQNSVGVMTVVEQGEPAPNQYRQFKLRQTKAGDDTGALREILTRRFNHPEWPTPDLIVVDGGQNQLNIAKKLFNNVVAVVKDEFHRPREILGPKNFTSQHEKAIILANHEAHRFAISYHRRLRKKWLN